MEHQDETLKQINRSGFPFQLRVEHEIRTSQAQHGWEVASREHPWGTPDSESSGFIDLVLSHRTCTSDRLVIECKRVKADDSRQLQWIFLLADQELSPIKRASSFEVGGALSTSSPLGSTEWKEARLWDNDVQVDPESPESEFCILSGDDSKRQPILETLCAEVLESIEGLAQEEVRIQHSQSKGRILRFIFPAIVTNAKLRVCQFKSSDVKIADGKLDLDTVTLTSMPFIRFRKSLATEFPKGKFSALKDAHQARERTVFIISAEGLPEFLKGWKVKGGPMQFAIDEFASKFDLWPHP